MSTPITALPVMEHFYTLQGEGSYSGVAAYFIRIGGCDVGCHWCDVKESWDADLHPSTTLEQMREWTAPYGGIIVVTGGEPLMYDCTDLTTELRKTGKRLHIETSGAYELSGNWDWICLSPKKTMLPKPSVFAAAHELKCIIYNKNDFKFAIENAAQVNPDCVLYLQPEWSKKEEMLPLIIDFIKENPQWRLSMQTHKYLAIP